ncbi:MAG: hypothetical protein HUJ82_05695 [Megasphaera sp.]|nr:hypothetical protein [Megasphaera sp.]
MAVNFFGPQDRGETASVGAPRAFSARQVMTAKNVKTVAETDRRRGGARYALRASRSDVVSLSLTPRSGI